LLYGIDRAAYIEVLKTTTAPVSVAEEVQPTPPEELAAAPVSAPLTEVVPSYSGRLAALRTGLEEFLSAEGWQPAEVLADDVRLLDSLLATADQNMGLDWKQREALQARLKVACRRVLVQFGIEVKKAEGIAERLVAWMRIQVPEAGDVNQEIP